MHIKSNNFGETPQGTAKLFTLTNNSGAVLRLSNYGGIVTAIEVPDRRGVLGDVTLGYDSLEQYLTDPYYFGALVGRFANRIAHGRFRLGGKTVQLSTNDGANHLHGGPHGFHKQLWQAAEVESAEGPAVELSRTSPAGEENFPGELKITARHTWTHDNALKIEIRATTDAPTILSMTHHSYFNLAGAGGGDILDHQVQLDSNAITAIDETLIPTGQLLKLAGTPLDFSEPRAVGERIGEDHPQLKFAGGYDHNFVLRHVAGELAHSGRETVRAARVVEPASGRVLEVFTNMPAVQFYSGNFLHDGISGKGGKIYGRRGGFCLEPQHFPDAPNRADFPSAVLNPGAEYRQTMIYRFSVA